MDPDAAIRSTDDDAAQSRLSAVRKGYLADPFIHLLVPRAHLAPSRPPLINIGTFLRCRTIDALVHEWLEMWPEGSAQIVSLGAGSDTRFWRLNAGPLKGKLAKYVEVDFPEVTTRKAMAIRKHAELRRAVGDGVVLERGGSQLTAPIYHLLPADLRIGQGLLFGALSSILSLERPLLVLAECVLPYMASTESASLLRWFPSTFRNSGIVIYEMFGLHDSFGKVMLANLQARSVELPGVHDFSTLEDERHRFLQAGYSAARAITLKVAKSSFTPITELERLTQLELLDEVEELDLVLSHYTVAVGWKTNQSIPMPWRSFNQLSGEN